MTRNPRAERAMLSRQIASIRFRLNHPDYYVKSGRYTPEQTKALKEKISGLESQRDRVSQRIKS